MNGQEPLQKNRDWPQVLVAGDIVLHEGTALETEVGLCLHRLVEEVSLTRWLALLRWASGAVIEGDVDA